MEEIIYQTKGVCSKEIIIKVEENTVKAAYISAGCDGNLTGIARLIEGMQVDAVIEKLEGIKCGRKATSCPDQIALALKEKFGK